MARNKRSIETVGQISGQRAGPTWFKTGNIAGRESDASRFHCSSSTEFRRALKRHNNLCMELTAGTTEPLGLLDAGSLKRNGKQSRMPLVYGGELGPPAHQGWRVPAVDTAHLGPGFSPARAHGPDACKPMTRAVCSCDHLCQQSRVADINAGLFGLEAPTCLHSKELWLMTARAWEAGLLRLHLAELQASDMFSSDTPMLCSCRVK